MRRNSERTTRSAHACSTAAAISWTRSSPAQMRSGSILRAGTGENAEHLNQTLASISMLYLVDLCSGSTHRGGRAHCQPKLVQRLGRLPEATTFCPPERQADVVTFSYSLTMIPDRFVAIDHAYEILKPGGLSASSTFTFRGNSRATARRRQGWANASRVAHLVRVGQCPPQPGSSADAGIPV